ncbi:GNAT family N-acetyltransferase [Streptococcus hillyeri]|uniref:GNAT family N-acetyltransferase n=1 Tax=Streptococcus hillyeri TaxID=2282420 RepID=UPI0034E19CE3
MENIYQGLAKFCSIETDRLYLRAVRIEDAEDMFAYAFDEENVRWTFPANKTLEETKNNIASLYLANPLGRWGIVIKETNRFIGTIDLMKIAEDVRRAEIGYTLNKHYWNKGYMTEAVTKILQVFFEDLQMSCLIARHDKENPASGRVMQKSGMLFSHEEPYAKIDKKVDERMVTMVHYRLTKEDYFRQVDNAVKQS